MLNKSRLPLLLLAIALLPLAGCGEDASASQFDDKVVEAACGTCLFGVEEAEGCPLAIRVDGKSYLVDGEDGGAQEDPHGEHGICSCVRQAKVTGEIVDGRFNATAFEFLPLDEKHSHGDGDAGHHDDEDDEDGEDHHDNGDEDADHHDEDGDGHDQDGRP